MDTRQQLVEEWKAKLEASSQPPSETGERFAWVRQIYARIYQFLVSCYGEGEWNADTQSTVRHMPFVENCPTTDGLAPKSSHRIRAALESIHRSNPGIATPGPTVGIKDDTWVVVTARKKPKLARAVHRYLVASGIESRLLGRTTDTAVLVRYEDFTQALLLVESVGESKLARISTRVDPRAAAGAFALVATSCTFLGIVLAADAMQLNSLFALCGLWISALAASWAYSRGHTIR